MIVMEGKNTNTLNNITDYNKFGTEMQDGRMTDVSDGKIYRLREAIMLTKVLGRELTKDEMSKFEC